MELYNAVDQLFSLAINLYLLRFICRDDVHVHQIHHLTLRTKHVNLATCVSHTAGEDLSDLLMVAKQIKGGNVQYHLKSSKLILCLDQLGLERGRR